MRLAWLVLWTICAAAQSLPETEAVRALRLLHSPGWQDKAWGAYFAGRLHSDAMREPIVDALREAAALRNEPPNSDPGSYLAVLFDAAIENGAEIPASILRPFELTRWQSQVIILLSFGKDNEEEILNLRTEKLRDIEWLAISNLLHKLKSERFYARVVSEIAPSHTFTLLEPGLGYGWGGGMGGTEFDRQPTLRATGFPPVNAYYLTCLPQAGDVLFVEGPRNVYYRRAILSSDEHRHLSGMGSIGDRQPILTAYLAPLAARSPEDTERIFHPRTDLEFHGDADLMSHVENALKQQEAAIRAFLHSASPKGIGYAGTKFTIESKFYDGRRAKTPLPKPAPHEFVLD